MLRILIEDGLDPEVDTPETVAEKMKQAKAVVKAARRHLASETPDEAGIPVPAPAPPEPKKTYAETILQARGVDEDDDYVEPDPSILDEPPLFERKNVMPDWKGGKDPRTRKK